METLHEFIDDNGVTVRSIRPDTVFSSDGPVSDDDSKRHEALRQEGESWKQNQLNKLERIHEALLKDPIDADVIVDELRVLFGLGE